MLVTMFHVNLLGGQAPASKSAIRWCLMGFLHRGSRYCCCYCYLFFAPLNGPLYIRIREPRHDRPFNYSLLKLALTLYEVYVLFVNGLPST